MSRRPSLTVVGHLAAAMAHDVRNPLNSIAIHADLVETRAKKMSGTEAEAIRRSTQVLLREVERIDGILTAFLDHVAPREIAKRPASVREVLASTIDRAGALAAAAGVTLRSEGPGTSEETWPLDSASLAHVLDAVVTNAVEASPRGRAVTLRARVEGDRGYIEILDEGPAIAPDVMARMFLLGFTTKEGRPGVGLAVAKQIAKSHGGSIQAHSDEKGTRIEIELPLDE